MADEIIGVLKSTGMMLLAFWLGWLALRWAGHELDCVRITASRGGYCPYAKHFPWIVIYSLLAMMLLVAAGGVGFGLIDKVEAMLGIGT